MLNQRGSVPIVIIAIIVTLTAFYLISSGKLSQTPTKPKPTIPPSSSLKTSSSTNDNSLTSSAKGVVQVSNPAPGREITSPLTVSGFVYGNKGTLTIKLKQKETGQYVSEDKIAQILGKADKISFAEAIQFGLPVKPQTGILEVIYKDESGQGLDDKVSIEVQFPSDLGSGK